MFDVFKENGKDIKFKDYEDFCYKIRKNFMYVSLINAIFSLILLIFSLVMTNIIFIIILLIAIVCDVFHLLRSYKDLKRNILEISDERKEELNKELSNLLFSSSSKDYFLTENYLIDYKYMDIIRYSDIMMMYKRFGINNDTARNPSEKINIITKDKKVVLVQWDMSVKTKERYKEDLMDFIKSKNNEILIGNTKENRQIIYEKYGIKFNRRMKKVKND